MGHGRAGQAMAGLNRTWQGMAGHDMALQGMQGVAHMAGSDHSYESSFKLEDPTNRDGKSHFLILRASPWLSILLV